MGVHWFFKPGWLIHAELMDQQTELEHRSELQSQRSHQEIAALRRQVRDLERQLLALETVLAERGIIEGHAETLPETSETQCSPAQFPTRGREPVVCPRCGKTQQGNRDRCYSCRLPFQYTDE